MERRAVMVGDPPSNGGAVLPGELRNATVNGIHHATVGGWVHCTACKSIGVIAKAGGPYRPSWYGFEIALEGDIVLCKCALNPVLIAKAISSGPPNVTFDDRIESLGALPLATSGFGGDTGITLWGSPAFFGASAICQIRFLLLDTNSKPLASVFYSVKQPDGKVIHGTSDSQGLTDRIQTDGAAAIEVYLGHVGVKLPAPLPIGVTNSAPSSVVAAQTNRLAKPWQLSKEGLGFVKDYETFSGSMYNDATGNATVGYGHLIHYGAISGAASEKPFLNGLTEDEASNLLAEKLTVYEKAINANTHVPLHQKEYDALVIFAFNVGSNGATNSKTMQVINAGLYELAPDEMMTWNKGKDPHTHQLLEIRGLTNRRKDEVKIFNQADYTRTK